MGIVEEIRDKLSSSWNADNTDGITPVITLGYDVGRTNVNSDVVEIHQLSSSLTPEKIGEPIKYIRTTAIQISIWSAMERAHADKMLKEVKRILTENAVHFTNANVLLIQRVLDRDFEFKQIRNRIVEVSAVKFLD